jgi:hypothetical protein
VKKSLVMTAVAFGVLFNAAAFAADTSKRNYTVDEINSALAFKGQPPLGSSRVLHDDHASARETKFVSTIVSTSNINSTSTIQSK